MSEQKGERQRPPQQQADQPGETKEMRPRPEDEMRHYRGSGKLADKVALVTGGDSGIGRAVAIGYAKEGADVAIVYLDEHEDARHAGTGRGPRAPLPLIAGDVGDEQFWPGGRRHSARGGPAGYPREQRGDAVPRVRRTLPPSSSCAPFTPTSFLLLVHPTALEHMGEAVRS